MEVMLFDDVGDVVHGVAAAHGSFFIRAGTELVCARRMR